MNQIQARAKVFEDAVARNGLDLPVNDLAVSPLGLLDPRLFDVGLDRSVEFGKQGSNEARLVGEVQRSDLCFQFGNSSRHVTSVQPALTVSTLYSRDAA